MIIKDRGLAAYLAMHDYKYTIEDKTITFDIELNKFHKLEESYKVSSFRKFHKIQKKFFGIQK